MGTKPKPFGISKQAVWEAWLRVKANRGAAGVDGESIADFESRLKDNLYRIWNRMSSGSYFPPPVRTVMIPKASGGKRPLGIPTVGDRVAQTVVKMYLEPRVEPHFHPDSYGYRPGKSALEAVGVARRRCWRNDWVVDLDIRGFFDNLDHSLTMRAVGKHTDCGWLLLYVERWLKAPAERADGTRVARDRGTPQGGVVSPLLANVFLHHAFDLWMEETYPSIPFERYADDIVVHCRSEAQARFIRARIAERLGACRLEAHPDKTQIVYCRDANRPSAYPNRAFDFLGYTFRPRPSLNRRGKLFVSFSPAVSGTALKAMTATMRRWRIHRRSDKSLDDLARMFRSVLSGWIAYYGKYYRSALSPVFRRLNRRLARWVQKKYKRLSRQRRATHWLRRIARREPGLFPHWRMVAP
jgi:RNA-directed DNA polymerase